MDDFEKADAEVVGVEVIPPGGGSTAMSLPKDVLAFRSDLVRKYHNGAPGLIAKLRAVGKEDMESILVAMIDEVIQETDHLLGNELVATNNGDLRDASVISFKRAEVLEKAIKAVQTRQQMERTSGIDLDSPAMMIVFRFFLGKAKAALERTGVANEVVDLFFRRFGEVTNDWKKELRENVEAMRTVR